MRTVSEALEQWVALTGVDLNSTSWSFGDWDIASMNKELTEALRLDPTGTTTYLLLECFLREYLAQKTFTAAQIMQDYNSLTGYLSKAERLFSIVQSDAAHEIAAHFRANVLSGLRHYRADREDVLAMVNNADVLPFLRRDALRSLESLRPYQFLSGADDPGPPQVISKVYQAWDINQLLIAVRDMAVSGVALVLLRDPSHPDRSYFAFVMRNGGNVTVLTDKTKWAHPAQADMARRPDRTFQARAWQNHFPYQLVKHRLDDKGDVIFEKEQQLAPAGLDLVPLMDIRDLAPAQVIWITMMLALIVERFWRQGWRAPALSYTAGMIQVRDKLVTDGNGNQLPAAASYQPITLDRLTVDEVSAEAMASQVPEHGVNAWIEARYRHTVTEDIVNQWAPVNGTVLQLPPVGQGQGVQYGNPTKRLFAGDPRPYALRGMSATEFGTEEELQKDRLWLARYNMARQLQKAADEEFASRKAEVTAWYQGQVANNQEVLLNAIATLVGRDRHRGAEVTDGADHIVAMLTVGELGDRAVFGHYDFQAGISLGEWDQHAGKHHRRCFLTDAAASYRARFEPKNAIHLAILAGCRVEDLPDVLRNWHRERQYVGNRLLKRLDPVETEVQDPWSKLETNVNVYLSKRGYARVIKAHGT